MLYFLWCFAAIRARNSQICYIGVSFARNFMHWLCFHLNTHSNSAHLFPFLGKTIKGNLESGWVFSVSASKKHIGGAKTKPSVLQHAKHHPLLHRKKEISMITSVSLDTSGGLILSAVNIRCKKNTKKIWSERNQGWEIKGETNVLFPFFCRGETAISRGLVF